MKIIPIVEFITWFSFIWVIFVYFIYPIILWFVHLFAKRPVKPGEFEPTISFLVSAYNEEAVMEEKIENILGLDYPPEKLEVVVVSDASIDRTDEIVRACTDKRVRLFRMPERVGKIPGLNAAIPTTTGEILVLTDANCMFSKDSLRGLTSYLADESIGAVDGTHIFMNKTETAVERGVGLYWRIEEWQKILESDIHSNAFTDGAMIALHRDLYPDNITGELNLDNVLTVCIVQKGKRLVMCRDATVWEESNRNPKEEFRGRVRTTVRGFCFAKNLHKFISFTQHPFFVLHLMFRKVFRWLCAPFLVLLFFGNMYLAWWGPTYRMCFGIQILFYLIALVGAFFARVGIKIRPVHIVYYFCLINLGAFLGWLYFLAGRKMATWQHATRKQDRFTKKQESPVNTE